MHPTESRVVWRMPGALRVMAIGGGCAFVLLMIFSLSQYSAGVGAWLVVVAVALLVAFYVSVIRRSCVVSNGQLVAKGRFATRRVDLRDLRQAAIGPGGHVWIQTHHPLDKRGGDVLCLRMIRLSRFTPDLGPSGDNAVEVIRAQAVAAGAELDPPVPNRKRAPSKKALIFSI